MQIYYGDLNDSKNLESTSFLQLNSCGSSTASDNEFLVLRSGRNDYHILYVTEGEADVYEGENAVRLTAGDFVLFPPRTPQKYKRLPHSKDLWIHFNGFQIPEIIRDATVPMGVSHAEINENVTALFGKLLTEHSMSGNTEKGLLLTLLYTLGGLISGKGVKRHSEPVQKALEYISVNYEKNFSNSFLANICNLSLGRFEHLFREETGMSAGAYRQRLRIENAKNLLTSTNLPVSEISELVGFPDQLYFSRLFKNKTGMSPSKYRRTDNK